MEKTLLSAKDLAERWGCSEGYINNLEQDGVIARVDLSKRLFPVKQIREIEKSEEPNPTLERVRELTDENRKLIRENESLKKSLAEMAKVIYGGY